MPQEALTQVWAQGSWRGLCLYLEVAQPTGVGVRRCWQHQGQDTWRCAAWWSSIW